VESSVAGSAGSVVHVDVYGEWVMLIVGGCNVQSSCYTEPGRYGLSCMYAEAVECTSLYGMYGIWSIGVEVML